MFLIPNYDVHGLSVNGEVSGEPSTYQVWEGIVSMPKAIGAVYNVY